MRTLRVKKQISFYPWVRSVERDFLPTDWSRWLGALLGSLLVGLTGVLPLFLLPANLGGSVNHENLKYTLSFAVGGLLGDVFLHLLPESYQHVGHPAQRTEI